MNNKFTKLCELYDRIYAWLGSNDNNVVVLINIEENHLSLVYDGCRICKISDYGPSGVILLEFEDNFCDIDKFLPKRILCGVKQAFVYTITKRIKCYNEKKGRKNMPNRCFIVEKMEVEQKYCEPDVINMTIRKEPDGLVPETGKKLKALIESLDPDKLSTDYRIDVNVDVDSNTMKKAICMSARGTGKLWATFNSYVTDRFSIKDVIFNDPATIVFWNDGSKTVVKCQNGETFDPEKGLAMAIAKKIYGGKHDYYEVFAKHVGRYNKKQKKEEEKEKTPITSIKHGDKKR